MSGTKAHAQRKEAEQQAKFEKLVALNDNRTALLNATITELKELYGAENINADHPLFAAIQVSANGSVIDPEQLVIDITAFKTQETE